MKLLFPFNKVLQNWSSFEPNLNPKWVMNYKNNELSWNIILNFKQHVNHLPLSGLYYILNEIALGNKNYIGID